MSCITTPCATAKSRLEAGNPGSFFGCARVWAPQAPGRGGVQKSKKITKIKMYSI
jgi:hypothetical protein